MNRRSFLKLIPFAPIAKLEAKPNGDPDEILTRAEIVFKEITGEAWDFHRKDHASEMVHYRRKRSRCFPGRWFNSKGEIVDIM